RPVGPAADLVGAGDEAAEEDEVPEHPGILLPPRGGGRRRHRSAAAFPARPPRDCLDMPSPRWSVGLVLSCWCAGARADRGEVGGVFLASPCGTAINGNVSAVPGFGGGAFFDVFVDEHPSVGVSVGAAVDAVVYTINHGYDGDKPQTEIDATGRAAIWF